MKPLAAQLDMDGGAHEIAPATEQLGLFRPEPAPMRGQQSLGAELEAQEPAETPAEPEPDPEPVLAPERAVRAAERVPAGTRAPRGWKGAVRAEIRRRPGITIPELGHELSIAHHHLYRWLPESEHVRRGRGWYAPDAAPEPDQEQLAEAERDREQAEAEAAADYAAEAASGAHDGPTPRAERAAAQAFERSVACSTCGAEIGKPCKRPSGHTVFGGASHAPRFRAACAAERARTGIDPGAGPADQLNLDGHTADETPTTTTERQTWDTHKTSRCGRTPNATARPTRSPRTRSAGS